MKVDTQYLHTPNRARLSKAGCGGPGWPGAAPAIESVQAEMEKCKKTRGRKGVDRSEECFGFSL